MKVKELIESEPISSVTVTGWVRTTRHYKKVSFIELYDGSCFNSIQIVFSGIDIKHVSQGSVVEVKGDLIESQGSGQELEIKGLDISVLADCDPLEYPMQKKEHTMEFFREHQHLRLRTKLFQSIMRVRSGLSFIIHSFFHEKDYLQFHTPIISHSDCEGAGEIFKLEDKEFFGKEAHLTISGQIEAEYGALALEKVYTFSPTFRAEDSHTSKHLAEFWMVEPEAAFHSYDDMIKEATEMLKYCIIEVKRKYSKEMEYLYTLDEELESRLELGLKEYEEIYYQEAIDLLGKRWGDDIDSESEKILVDHFKCPVVIIDFPKEMKAFYMKDTECGKTVKGFDIIFPQVGEIVGGSEREDRYDVLLSKIEDAGIEESEMSMYLESRKFASVQHSGFGLGFERLVMFITGTKNIRDVIPFPKYPK